MAVRGGKTKTLKVEHEHPRVELPLPAKELAALLQPLIHRELATIGAIDTVLPREDHPGYVMLLRAAKTGKQASVEQMSTMIRFTGAQPPESAGPIEAILKLQTALARRLGRTSVLLAMRLVEEEIVRAYGDAYDRLDGMFQKGLQKCWHRAIRRVAVLNAHIADPKGRVCFRCLFDRPALFPSIERTDPHPYTYLCAACHEEVLSDLPPDLVEPSYRWTDHERESQVLERALGRPSKLKAELLVISKMADLAPDLPPPPMPRKIAEDVSPRRPAPAQPRPRVELGGIAESELEQTYSDALFDYESVRGSW